MTIQGFTTTDKDQILASFDFFCEPTQFAANVAGSMVAEDVPQELSVQLYDLVSGPVLTNDVRIAEDMGAGDMDALPVVMVAVDDTDHIQQL